MMTYEELRAKYPIMIYDAYHYDVQPDGLHIAFSFHIGDINFHPEAVVERRPFLDFEQPKETMDALVFSIGMAELVSYWKCACPPMVVVKCGSLDERQVVFWRKLYWRGEGEFFYVNGIEAKENDFLFLQGAGRKHAVKPSGAAMIPGPRYLVPIGGGKDSVVTLEALKCAGCDVMPLIMNPRGATVLCAERGGFDMEQVLVIRRNIDSKLLKLNQQGYLNGHTPFSAMLAFYTLLAAQLSGRTNIALSNESSANESTVTGSDVNHQYSKSLEFENDFRGYVKDNMGGNYRYFSFLRPLSELQIAMLFARHDKYFDVFKSCNVGSKQDIWCGHCAKCLFAYIILSPFIEPATLERIFDKNMLDDETMRPEFEQLTGQTDVKPFECVGTRGEVNSALSMTIAKYYPLKRPALLKDYVADKPQTSLTALFNEHNLLESEVDILKRLLS
ncbi:MAG: hypothetical protein SPJ13_00535 [Bacteroidales bacterium]|nr:hypothetical protein [Bacteroidales bacterium]